MAEPSDRRFVVGCALLPKKQRKFVRPSLVSTARDRGVDLVSIDLSRPLVEQGPFDCVIHKIHKLHDEEWETQIADFAAKNPGVPIVDQPLSIESLDKRITSSGASELDGTFRVPNQMMFYDSRSDAFKVIVDCRFPMIAKLLSKSGELSPLLFSFAITRDLEPRPPLVLQEFIDRGGVFFKVYVAGDHIHCPPSRLFEKIARDLRHATGLRLFAFDMIEDVRIPNYCYIIDINYFPGYAKLPGYEEFMTDFFWDMVHDQKEE